MAEQEVKKSSKKSWVPIYLSVLIMFILVGSYFFLPAFAKWANDTFEILTSGDNPRIERWVKGFGIWGPLTVVMAMVVQMFLIMVPSPLLMVVAVVAYGPYWGAALAILAVMVASSIGYLIGKYIGTRAIEGLIGHKTEKKVEFYVDRYGLYAIIISRLSPVFSTDAMSFVAGALRMGYWRFIGATFVGITPLAALIAYFGENNKRLEWGLIWISAISVVVFVGYVIFDRRKRKKMESA